MKHDFEGYRLTITGEEEGIAVSLASKKSAPELEPNEQLAMITALCLETVSSTFWEIFKGKSASIEAKFKAMKEFSKELQRLLSKAVLQAGNFDSKELEEMAKLAIRSLAEDLSGSEQPEQEEKSEDEDRAGAISKIMKDLKKM